VRDMTDKAPAALLLWDVDQTLIESSGATRDIYALAFELLTGRPPDVRPQTDGRTELTIIANILAANGADPAAFPRADQWDALVTATSRHSAALAERGHALPGAAACLERAAAEPGVRQSVLTGNIRPNAVVKLRAFGLDQWIDWEIGGFGWDSPDRPALVAAAQERARGRYGFDAGRDVTVLVGDTTRDVDAGLIGGARVIAVATGIHDRAELAAAGPDVVLDDLADTGGFLAALRSVRAQGPVPARRPDPQPALPDYS
jgi:phosphoglycolate phosphatase